MGLLPLSLTRPSVTETSHEYSQTTCTSQASVHTSGSGCGGSCNPTCLLTLFLPAAPSLLSACTSPGAVCHHHPRTPCQRQMGIRERSTAVLPSHPKDLKRRWEKEWQLFMCSCPERRPQLCCSRPPCINAKSCRVIVHPQEALPARLLVFFTQNGREHLLPAHGILLLTCPQKPCWTLS